ncbi:MULTISPECIES: T7SS effector LXG polymorphic toxin [Bacillus]|uniref:T7SS effector LXG polymorphic toxin n=1 Tax=Bacillus TaxID=1386 RepID=UPI000989CD6F|nr:T7SS effector LXG polymorphic toxin [Bacillus sonorensis]
MKVYEAKSLKSAMEARSHEYKKAREQFVNLQRAFMGMADLGDEFQGRGADNIKSFYKEHARNVDEWLGMFDMQIAFLDSIAGALEEADLAGNTFVDTSFLENELEIAYRKSNEMVAEQKQAIKAILEDIKDIVPLGVFSTFDFKEHISNSKVIKDNTVDKIHETDWKLKNEYEKSELNQDYIDKRIKALLDATGKGKNAQPINFNAKAYYDTKVFKYKDEIHKKTEEYLTIKKEEAEKRRIEELKEKLAKVSDPDEYLEMAKEIGYDNLDSEQKQYVQALQKMKRDEFFDPIGFLGGVKDNLVDAGIGLWDAATHPKETLEGIGHVIIHPVDTFNIIKKDIEESFERDVINGDAYSRSHWFGYALTTVGTSLVGSKGADKLSKVSKAGKIGKAGAKVKAVTKKATSKTMKVSKEALEKSVASFKQSMQRVASKIKGIQIHNPFEPQVEFAGIGKVPYNVLNGEKIKEKFIQFAKKVSDGISGSRKKSTKLVGKEIKLDWLGDNYKAVEIEGTVKVGGKERDISRRVYQKVDIDWNYTPKNPKAKGLSNKELVAKGRAPYAVDKNGIESQIELHHIIQKEAGDMVEIIATTHDEYKKILHGLIKNGDSFRNDKILDKQFNNFRRKYWSWRSENLD